MTTDPPARFRHRSPEVEAVQWTGSNADQLRAFCGPDFDEIDLDDRTEDPDQTAAVREANHGTWRGLAPGDWVVRLDGGLYEFSAADFAKQYEPAAPPVPADRSGLRERIAEALEHHLSRTADIRPGRSGALAFMPEVTDEERLRMADAVLSVLPPAADRAAVLRELADRAEEWDGHITKQELRRMARKAETADGPSRVAAEDQQAETQAPALGCGCPDEDAMEHGFGTPDCTCIPFTRQTDPPRYLNRPTDTVDMISGWERGGDCPHHTPPAVVAEPGEEN